MSNPSRIHSDEDPTNRDIMEAVSRLETRAARVEHLLTGSSDPSRGLVVRVDRLEQSHEGRKFLVGSAVVAAMGAVAASAWSALKGH